MWSHLAEYLRAPLSLLSRALNPPTSRAIEEQNQLAARHAELQAALAGRAADPAALSALGRRGFGADFRPRAWACILGTRELSEADFERAVVEAFGSAPPPAPPVAPLADLQSLGLDAEQLAALGTILHLIGQRYPHLELLPILPAVGGVLLRVLPPAGAFACLDAMVRQTHGSEGARDWPFFPHNRRESLLFGRIFDELLLKLVPNVHRHVLRLQRSDAAFNPRWTRLLADFFTGVLPSGHILRIFDAYVIEGYKVVIRYALAHATLHQHAILRARSAEDFCRAIYPDASADPHPHPFKLLQKTAYSFKFSRNVLVRLKSRHRKLSWDDFEEGDKAVIMQRALPRLLGRPSSLVADGEWAAIWSWVPGRYRILDLEMVFSSAEHGHRLASLFECAADCEPLLLLVETTDGHVFGAYLSRSLQGRSCRRFFGTGETFLFNLRPVPMAYPWAETHDNQQFVYADSHFLAVGCSAGKFGIWIDRDLNQVVSSPCDTYRNTPLIAHESGWSDIYCIEAYRFK